MRCEKSFYLFISRVVLILIVLLYEGVAPILPGVFPLAAKKKTFALASPRTCPPAIVATNDPEILESPIPAARS